MQQTRSTSALIVAKAALFCLVFTVLFVLLSFFKSFVPGQWERMAHGITGTMAALLTTFLFLKYDRRRFADIGLSFEKTTFIRFLWGFATGIVIMGLLSLSVIYASGFRMETNANSSVLNFLMGALPLIPLAFMEEMAFRGYPLEVLKDKTGVRVSILITAVLFALYHIANGWAVQNAFLGAGAWGLLYGAAAVYGRGIALPTGMHFAANFTTAAFGTSTDSFHIWVLKQENGLDLENYEASQLATLIPQISILVLGIVAMEWVARNTSEKNE